MGIVKLGAVVAGMLDLKGANEWVVTTKVGSAAHRSPVTKALPMPVQTYRLYAAEMGFSCFILWAALYGIFGVNKFSFSIFLTLQGELGFWPGVGSRAKGGDSGGLVVGCLKKAFD